MKDSIKKELKKRAIKDMYWFHVTQDRVH